MNASAPVMQYQTVERRGGIKEDHAISTVDKGVDRQAERSSSAERDQNLIVWVYRKVLIGQELVGDGLAQLGQSPGRRPAPAVSGQLAAGRGEEVKTRRRQ